MGIDFNYRHLLFAAMMLSVVAAARTPLAGGKHAKKTATSVSYAAGNDSIATEEEVQQTSFDPLVAEKERYRKRSVDLYEQILANTIREQYQPGKTEKVAEMFRNYEKEHPIDSITFTSEWLSEEFIQGYYYYLPLLDKYAQYTTELASIITTISDNLQNNKAGSIKIFKEGTEMMLASLLKNGSFKTRRATYVMEYGPVYNQREEGASIPYLDNILTELRGIIDNITDVNAAASLDNLQKIKRKLEIRIPDSSDRGNISNATRADVPDDSSKGIVNINTIPTQKPAESKKKPNPKKHNQDVATAKSIGGTPTQANKGKWTSGRNDSADRRNQQPKQMKPAADSKAVADKLSDLNNKHISLLEEYLDGETAGSLRMYMMELSEMYAEFRDIIRNVPQYSGIELIETDIQITDNGGKVSEKEIEAAADQLYKLFDSNKLRKLIKKNDIEGYARSLNEIYSNSLKIKKAYSSIF